MEAPGSHEMALDAGQPLPCVRDTAAHDKIDALDTKFTDKIDALDTKFTASILSVNLVSSASILSVNLVSSASILSSWRLDCRTIKVMRVSVEPIVEPMIATSSVKVLKSNVPGSMVRGVSVAQRERLGRAGTGPATVLRTIPEELSRQQLDANNMQKGWQ